MLLTDTFYGKRSVTGLIGNVHTRRNYGPATPYPRAPSVSGDAWGCPRHVLERWTPRDAGFTHTNTRCRKNPRKKVSEMLYVHGWMILSLARAPSALPRRRTTNQGPHGPGQHAYRAHTAPELAGTASRSTNTRPTTTYTHPPRSKQHVVRPRERDLTTATTRSAKRPSGQGAAVRTPHARPASGAAHLRRARPQLHG